MFDLLGDLRTRARWGASNTSLRGARFGAAGCAAMTTAPTLVEVQEPQDRQAGPRRRYDYRELVPLLRHRYEPNHPEVRERARPAARRAHVHRRAPAGARRRRFCAKQLTAGRGRTRAPPW